MAITVAQLQARVTADTSDAESKLSGFGNKVEGLGGGIGKMAGVAAVGFLAIGAGAAAGFGAAINSAADFQATISEVAAVSGASGEELKGLSDLALKMGKDTAFSASEAADAMAELAKGGISVGDMAKVLPGTLDLAAAGGLGLAEAATIATDSMSIFGKQGVTMDQVANAFAGAANISSISVGDMAQSMKYVGPVAASMGLSLEDTAAAIALLGSNGIKGSEAGTGLRTMLLGLSAPTDKARGLMKDLGLEFFDSSGHMKDMGGIADQLKSHLAGMSDQQRIATLETLFGKEGMSAAIAVMGDGENSIQAYTDKLKNASSAHATGVAMMDNFKGSMDQLKGSIETAGITLGLALLPVLRNVVDAVTGGVNAIIPFVQQWGPVLASGLEVGIGAIARFGGGVASAIGAVLGAVGQLVSGQITLGQFVGGIQIMASTVLARFGELVTIAAPYVGQFFSAIGTFVSAALPQIVALMGQVAGAFSNWLIGTAIPFLAANLPVWLAAISGWLTGTALPAVVGLLTQVGTAFGDWIGTTAIPWVTANLPLWWATISGYVTGTAIPAATATLVGLGTAFGDWITTTAIPFVTANMPVWVNTVLSWVENAATQAAAQALTLASALGDWITTTAIPFVTANMPIWKETILSWVENAATSAATGAEQLAHALGDWVSTQAIPYLTGNFPAWKNTIVSWMDNAKNTAINDGDKLAHALADWISDSATPKTESNMRGWVDAITNGLDQANSAIDGANKGLGDRLSDWVEQIATPQTIAGMARWLTAIEVGLAGGLPLILIAVKPMGEALYKWVDNLATPGMAVSLANFVNTLNATLLKLAFIVPTIMMTVGRALITGLWNGITGEWPTVETWLSSLPGRIKGAVGDLSNALFAAGAGVIGGLLAGIKSGIPALDGLLGDLTKMIPQKKGPPAKDAILLFDSGQLIMQGLIDGIDEKQLDLEKKLTDVTKSIFDTIKSGIDAMRALRGFDPRGLSNLNAFAQAAGAVVQEFENVASFFAEKGLDAASKFADTAGKVLGLIGNGVAAIAALAKVKDVPFAAVHLFANVVGMVVQELQNVASLIGSDGLDATSAFSETAGKVLDLIGKGVDSIAQLSGITDPGWAAIHLFGTVVATIVQELGNIATFFQAEGLAATDLFTATAGKALDIIGKGIAALDLLSGVTDPGFEAIHLFANVVAEIVQEFENVASFFESDGLAAAAAFTGTAGDVLKTVGDGVSGIMAIHDFIAPSKLAIDNFVYAVKYIVERFAYMATFFSEDGLKAATAFSGAAKASLDATKSGTDAVKGFEKLVVPSKEAIDHLFAAIVYVVGKMRDNAIAFGGEGLRQATAFANAGSAVAKAVGDTVNLIKAWNEKPIAGALQAGMNALAGDFGIALTGMQNLVGQSATFLAAAHRFEDNLKEAASAVLSAIAAMTEAAGAKIPDLPSLPSGNSGGGDKIVPIHKVGNVSSIPHLASGGIVTDPTVALIGEGRYPEAVVPLRPGMGGLGGSVVVNINAPVYGVDNLEDVIVRAVEKAGRRGRLGAMTA